jgi:tRNA G18 (ribose-2'-O)-methylase SpoU
MPKFEHVRHKEPSPLVEPRPLVVACVPMRSNVNLSRIVRAAACCGVVRIVACGNPRLDPKIARDGVAEVDFEVRRSLPPVINKLKADGYVAVGLEQTTNSQSMHTFAFPRKTVLVIGNERLGLEQAILDVLDHVVEIPVYGLPFSYNAATATCMALYEYCRQYPNG